MNWKNAAALAIFALIGYFCIPSDRANMFGIMAIPYYMIIWLRGIGINLSMQAQNQIFLSYLGSVVVSIATFAYFRAFWIFTKGEQNIAQIDEEVIPKKYWAAGAAFVISFPILLAINILFSEAIAAYLGVALLGAVSLASGYLIINEGCKAVGITGNAKWLVIALPILLIVALFAIISLTGPRFG